MLSQRQERWADVVQMLYQCFFVCLLGQAEGWEGRTEN